MGKNLQKTCPVFRDGGSGTVLHAVQLARVFPDSKTFVDMKLKSDLTKMNESFKALTEKSGNTDSDNLIDQIKEFVSENFEDDEKLHVCKPKDWIEHPEILSRITDQDYSGFASELNIRWQMLCRDIPETNPDQTSLLYIPNPVIVPGGRFREVYYWDSYWIMIGLLACQMGSTVKGMIGNFVHLVKEHGMIPNGGRTYYLCRSQPPLFIQMVDLYINSTNDIDFLGECLDAMETEFNYWLKHHFVSFQDNGETFEMARYICTEDGPRPESYVEDFELVKRTDGKVDNLYQELKTAAETGWDFSSRWFVTSGESNVGNLEDTRASNIIPVDLNSILEKNARILSKFFAEDVEKSTKYENISRQLQGGIEKVLWNPESGIWNDYDFVRNEQRNLFSISNFTPLWTESLNSETKKLKVSQVVDYIKANNLQQYPGGIPTTLNKTGQQWDFPNCWPPVEHILVIGLLNTDHKEAEDLAFEFARKRVEGAYLNFKSTGHMYEKYDATDTLRVGSGGEYGVQLGFGWTNGVVLDFLDKFAEKLVAPNI